MNIPFFLFEIAMILLFAFSLKHAVKEGKKSVILLLSGIVYGVLLEWATIQQLDAYEYGRFYIMIDDVPLMIGVGWGVILYSVLLFSNATTLPWYSRPVLDGVLALNIDLAMDAVAIRFGMWDWGLPMNEGFFGVPFENFWAWFWVISGFSLAFRFLERTLKKGSDYSGIGAVVLGVIWVMITNFVIVSVVPDSLVNSVILFLFMVVGFFLYRMKSYCKLKDDHYLMMLAPLVFHIFFIVGGLLSGVFVNLTTLLVFSIFWFILGLEFHLWAKRPVSN